MKQIIRKWYKKLGFPTEWDDEFENLLEKEKLSPCTLEKYDDKESLARNLPMFLYFCENVEKQYKELGISEKVLLDTLSDILIWAKMFKSIYGTPGLEETKWISRHLGLRLFRLGRLQFCMAEGELEIHIPAGESMTPELCRDSIDRSKTFFAKYFPEFVYSKYTCHSWLLDDTILNFVGKDSNIAKFMRMFDIKSREESYSALKYVFRHDARPENLEDFEPKSRMAKEIKEYVTSGGKLYEVLGEIPKNKEI
ncbi:MAG: DUF5596 domain-containing protein [Oscillospiraceae bacterium]|nr:DUF5596 domain-containing protein [Oscillospiraceae bacterium]